MEEYGKRWVSPHTQARRVPRGFLDPQELDDLRDTYKACHSYSPPGRSRGGLLPPTSSSNPQASRPCLEVPRGRACAEPDVLGAYQSPCRRTRPVGQTLHASSRALHLEPPTYHQGVPPAN